MTFNSPVANLLGSPRKADLRSDSQLLYSDTSLFQRSLVISETLNLTPLRPATGSGQSESGSPSLSYDSIRETIETGIEAFVIRATEASGVFSRESSGVFPSQSSALSVTLRSSSRFFRSFASVSRAAPENW